MNKSVYLRMSLPISLLFYFRSGKRWDQKLVKPDLNYSDIFSDDVGTDEGALFVLQHLFLCPSCYFRNTRVSRCMFLPEDDVESKILYFLL